MGGSPARDTTREVRGVLALASRWLRILPSTSGGIRDPEGVERVMRFILSRLQEIADSGDE